MRRGARRPGRDVRHQRHAARRTCSRRCARRGAGAVVVVTSDKCYRNDGAGRPFREDDPLGGATPTRPPRRRRSSSPPPSATLGLPVATARAGNVIGGGDWGADRLVPDCVRAALAGEPRRRCAHPDAVRPWQHVLDPLDGYLRLAERLVARRRRAATAWNFGPAEATRAPVGWLVERVARALAAAALRGRAAGRRRGRGAAAAARRRAGPRAARLGAALGSRGRARRYRLLVRRVRAGATCARRDAPPDRGLRRDAS